MACSRAVNNLTCPQRYKNVFFLNLCSNHGKTSAILAKSEKAFREALVSLLTYVECRLADFISLRILLKLHL